MMGTNFTGLVDTYIQRSFELKKDIMNNNNVEQLIQDVHSLKGSSGTMGAKKLFSLCESFELKLKNGESDSHESEMEKTSNELDVVHKYLAS